MTSHEHTNIGDRVRELLATAFGLGYLPIAPGTWGTLLGVAIFVLVGYTQTIGSEKVCLAVALFVWCTISVALGSWGERKWSRKDPPPFVADEVAGYLLVVLLFRAESLVLTSAWAFVASRVFDIFKPPPGRRLEKLPGGWGILLDDLVASVYAAAFLHIVLWLLPQAFGQ